MGELTGDSGAPLSSGGLAGLLGQGDRLISKVATHYPALGHFIARTGLSARGLLLAFIGLLLLLIVPPLVLRVLRRAGRFETNFRGERIPQSFGIAILIWAGVMVLVTGGLFPELRPAAFRRLLLICGFGGLGFADDRWGDRKIKGLRGHFRAAFVERKITTGFIKAVGGAFLACLLGYLTFPTDIGRAVLTAALTALCSNGINLFDLRPGRAAAVFIILSILFLACVVSVGHSAPASLFLVLVLVPALVVYERDARAQVMLGDAGSNLLGAALGYAVGASAPPLWLGTTLVAALVGLHVLAERVSITRLIERSAVLSRIDRLTGIR